MKSLYLLPVLALACLCLPVSISAQDTEPSAAQEDYIYRHSVMEVISAQRGLLRDMATGEREMNEAAFSRAAAALAAMLAIIPDAFAGRGMVDESRARPEIWENWDDFVAKAEELGAIANEVAGLAASGYVDAAKGKLEDLSCGGCHRDYRVEEE